jgi:hypothetical protein
LAGLTTKAYETDLIELMMAEHNQVPPAQQVLDFNDDLPF